MTAGNRDKAADGRDASRREIDARIRDEEARRENPKSGYDRDHLESARHR